MKDISMIRIIRYLIAMFIVLTFAAYPNPANAETGTVSIDHEVTQSYQATTGVQGAATFNFTTFNFSTSSYQKVSEYYVTDIPTAFFKLNGNSTYFTCLSGCTGGGFVSYNKLGQIIDWVFNSENTYTSSNIQVVYELNIFDSYNLDTAAQIPHSAAVGYNYGATAPFYLVDSTYTFPWRDVSVTFVTHNAITRVITDVDYQVTYPFTFWSAHVTKDGVINTKIAFENSTSQQFVEGTFNSDNLNASATYTTGLYINVSLADGFHQTQLINATNAVLATQPNNPSNNTVNGVGLAWEFNTYTIDTTGNVTWVKTTPALACDNIKIYDEVDVLRATVLNPNDVGYYKIMLNREGTWKAEYRRQTLCGLSVEEVLNTAYTTVPNPEASYLIINATTIAGKPENVTYRSGRIGPYTNYLAVLNEEGQPEGKYSISGYQINVEGTSQVVINTAGPHTIRICDAFGCDPVVATTNTVFNTSIPTSNITVSNITMDNTVYSFEDTAIITYAIDNFNYSNKAILITSFNWDYGVEQTRYSGFTNQTGSVQELLSFFLGRYVYTGQYSMRLVGRNETGDYILAFWNFTISDLDAEGYMLKMSKNSLCIGESNTFKVLSPTTSTLNVTLNTNGNVFNSYSINMNKTISYKPSAIGTYSVILYSPEWYVKRSVTFDVVSCVTPTPTPGATQGAQQAKAMANMLMSNVFWAFIITAGLMIAIAWKTRHGMAAVAIGALSMTVFASIGWFPLWAFFSVVIICATLLAANWVRQQFDIGTSGD